MPVYGGDELGMSDEVSRGRLQANISRLKQCKKENLRKKDMAKTSTEESHYGLLVRKNQSMINRYEEELMQ